MRYIYSHQQSGIMYLQGGMRQSANIRYCNINRWTAAIWAANQVECGLITSTVCQGITFVEIVSHLLKGS